MRTLAAGRTEAVLPSPPTRAFLAAGDVVRVAREPHGSPPGMGPPKEDKALGSLRLGCLACHPRCSNTP